MNLKILFILFLIILGFIGVNLIGIGITGKVTMNEYLYGKLCLNDKDCGSSEVCCRFYQENSGVCDSITMCEKINELTMEEKTSIDKWNAIKNENPSQKIYKNELIVGIIIIFVVFIFLFYIFESEKNINIKNLKNRKKKK